MAHARYNTISHNRRRPERDCWRVCSPTSDHQTKGGARTALDTLFQLIIDGPWFTRYVGCGLIYLLLVDQHRDSKGLGGVGTCGGDGAVGRQVQAVCGVGKPLEVSAWRNISRWETSDIGSKCNRHVCLVVGYS